jgi:GNAT superfamily N-acetyltransferase
VAIQYRNELPPAGQFWDLFATTGWNEKYKATPDELATANARSWYVISAYDDDLLVGFGRLLSDGVMHAMIYDLIVLPAYQGRGIGGQIMDLLIRQCLRANIRDIQLFCAKGKRAFYEHRGFATRPDDAPGMQYLR